MRKVLLSERDLEAEYGLNRRTSQGGRLKGGGPPYIKAGARVLYRREDVEAWLAARVRRSTSDPGAEVPTDARAAASRENGSAGGDRAM